jgi:hypothetical protein
MPRHLGYATLYLVAAYFIVTILGFGLTVAFAAVMPPAPAGTPAYALPAYEATEPWHPLLNLLVFPVFGWLYLRGLPAETPRMSEAWRVGVVWLVVTLVVDLVGWVLIPHPWQMPLADFYIDYQPWITLVYLVILLSPVMALAAPARRAARPT